jgi:hypothetical protein
LQRFPIFSNLFLNVASNRTQLASQLKRCISDEFRMMNVQHFGFGPVRLEISSSFALGLEH